MTDQKIELLARTCFCQIAIRTGMETCWMNPGDRKAYTDPIECAIRDALTESDRRQGAALMSQEDADELRRRRFATMYTDRR